MDNFDLLYTLIEFHEYKLDPNYTIKLFRDLFGKYFCEAVYETDTSFKFVGMTKHKDTPTKALYEIEALIKRHKEK